MRKPIRCVACDKATDLAEGRSVLLVFCCEHCGQLQLVVGDVAHTPISEGDVQIGTKPLPLLQRVAVRRAVAKYLQDFSKPLLN